MTRRSTSTASDGSGSTTEQTTQQTTQQSTEADDADDVDTDSQMVVLAPAVPAPAPQDHWWSSLLSW